MNLRWSSQDVALTAICAALSAVVAKVFPGIPILGLSDASIKLDSALAPIYGMLIGPYLGFFAALVGRVIVADHLFSLLTSFSTAISAFVAGFMVQSTHASGRRRIHGWMIAGSVVGLLILGWYTTWVGRQAPFFPILHFAGLFIVLIGRERIADAFEKKGEYSGSLQPKPYFIFLGVFVLTLGYISSKLLLEQIEIFAYFSLPLYLLGGVTIVYGLLGSRVREKFVVAVVLASYCGVVAGHMVGTLIFIQFAGPYPSFFMEILPIVVAERLLFTAIATIVGVGLISSIRRAGLYWKKE